LVLDPSHGRRVVTTLFTVLFVLTAVVAPGASARAADNALVPGLTITPATASVGEVVTFVATVTNNSSVRSDQVVLGVDVATGLRALNATGTVHCTPRNLGHLVYCGVGYMAPQQTSTLTFTVIPAASGSYTSHTYTRPLYTGPEADAYSTLTVK
jgi:uncharacterized repeat protein (TIGR01451 family)